MASRHLLKALFSTWNAAAVDTQFTALWPADRTTADFNVFNDSEASPEQPYPYLVVEQLELGIVENRMTSRSSSQNRRIQRTPVLFNIHANQVELDTRSAKEIAADFADVVMGVYGDSATSAQAALDFDVGGHILTQYIRDYGVRTGDREYQWIVAYEFLYDIPVVV